MPSKGGSKQVGQGKRPRSTTVDGGEASKQAPPATPSRSTSRLRLNSPGGDETPGSALKLRPPKPPGAQSAQPASKPPSRQGIMAPPALPRRSSLPVPSISTRPGLQTRQSVASTALRMMEVQQQVEDDSQMPPPPHHYRSCHHHLCLARLRHALICSV